jgi:hypothetical protein
MAQYPIRRDDFQAQVKIDLNLWIAEGRMNSQN